MPRPGTKVQKLADIIIERGFIFIDADKPRDNFHPLVGAKVTEVWAERVEDEPYLGDFPVLALKLRDGSSVGLVIQSDPEGNGAGAICVFPLQVVTTFVTTFEQIEP